MMMLRRARKIIIIIILIIICVNMIIINIFVTTAVIFTIICINITINDQEEGTYSWAHTEQRRKTSWKVKRSSETFFHPLLVAMWYAHDQRA